MVRADVEGDEGGGECGLWASRSLMLENVENGEGNEGPTSISNCQYAKRPGGRYHGCITEGTRQGGMYIRRGVSNISPEENARTVATVGRQRSFFSTHVYNLRSVYICPPLKMI